MPQNWTPADRPQARAWHRAGVVAGLLLLVIVACGGDSDRDTVIPRLQADITIDPPPAGDAVYLDLVDVTDNLITLNVMLNLAGGGPFNAFTLHFKFDPTVVNFATFAQSPETDGLTFNPFGQCGSAATFCDKYPPPGPPPACDAASLICTSPPLAVGKSCEDASGNPDSSRCGPPGTPGPVICPTPGNPNSDGHLLLGFTANDAGACDSHPGGGLVKLVTLGFNAVAPTDGTRLQMISGNQSGDCAILSGVVNLGIPFSDGNATITAVRR